MSENPWLDIETAPKDGTPIILAVWSYSPPEYIVGEGCWRDRGWWWANQSESDYYADPIEEMTGRVKYWQPLPPPPSQDQSS